MKKIFILYILFQLIYSVTNAQIKLVGNITTNGVASYPTHIDSLGKGGYMTMPTIGSRDSIPTLRRKYGMLVYVQSIDSLYKLSAPTLDNSAWTALGLSSASQASGNLALKLNLLDTANMLTSRFARDTMWLSNRINLKAPVESPTFTGTVSGVSKSMVGLSNADNTSDADKPVSTASQTALNLKFNISDTNRLLQRIDTITLSNRIDLLSSATNTATGAKFSTSDTSLLLQKRDTASLSNRIDLKAPIASPTFTGTVSGITKSMVGLGSVDNTTDANKPVSTAQLSALDLKLKITDTSFLLQKRDTITLSNRIDLLTNATSAATGAKFNIADTNLLLQKRDTITLSNRIDLLTNATNTATGGKLSISDTSYLLQKADTLSLSNRINLKAPIASPAFTGIVTGISKDMIGLGSADNTSDANKPISNSTQSELNLKLRIVDTANLLQRRDTITLSNRINLKLNLADTATMLTNRIKRDTSFLLQKIDTITLSNRIDLLSSATNTATGAKFSTSDTSFLLQKADTLSLSNRINLKAPIESPTFTGTVSGITKTMVGLGNVNNTTDLNKPISTATQTALDLKFKITDTSLLLQKADTITLSNRINLKAPIESPTFTGTVSGVSKSMVGLANAENTSDADKPISTATQNALNLKFNIADTNRLLQRIDTITLSNRIDLLSASSSNATGTKFSTSDTSLLLQKRDTITLSNRINLKAPIASPTFTGTVSGISKTMVGLNNVDNTTDANKPVSTATQTELNLKLNIVDTSYLLQRRDTSTLSNRIDLKLNISDTAVMLTNRIKRDTSFLLQKIDTITLSNRIDLLSATSSNATGTKFSISDTTLLFQKRDTSYLLQKNDTITLSNRINLKAPIASPTFTGTVSGISKTMVGLNNVDNTTDANKPVSTATQTALNLKFNIVDTSYLLQRRDTSTLSDRIDLKLNISDTAVMLTDRIKRDTSFLLQKRDTITLSNRIDLLSATSSNATGTKFSISDTTLLFQKRDTSYLLQKSDTSFLLQKKDTSSLSNRINLKAPIASPTFTGTVSGISKTMVGLSNVDNTTDANKPISTATQTALNLKLNIVDTSYLLQRSDTSTLSDRINLKLNISDTATMLTNRIKRDTSFLIQKADTSGMLSMRFARDTASLSNRINSISGFSGELASGKLAIADTALMLTNRIKRDTSFLLQKVDTIHMSNRIDLLQGSTIQSNGLKLNIADTSYLLQKSDTATLSRRINYKLNISDTALMLTNRIKRDTSFLLQKRDTLTLSNRIDMLSNSSSYSAGTKLNISDTVALLQKRDTINLSDRIDLKAPIESPTFTGTVVGISKSMVGLSNADNTSDLNKPISTLTHTALDAKLNITDTSLLLQRADTATLSRRINLKLNISDTALMLTNRIKRDTSFLLQKRDTLTLSNRIDLLSNSTSYSAGTKLNISDTVALLHKRDTITLSDRIDLKAPIESPTFTGTVAGISKTMVGLSDADNTSDVNKPISTAAQTALNTKFNISDTTLLLHRRDTITLSNRINYKLNISDTALMLTNRIKKDTSFLLQKRDTMTLSNRIDLLSNSSSYSAVTKLNISDTVTLMHKIDTITLSNRIDLKAPIASPTFTGTVTGISKSMVGLSDADNTSDVNKPISTATQTALDAKFNITDTSLLLHRRDTITLSNRINFKLNISDTALMLTNRIKRDTSFLLQKRDTSFLLQRRDTVNLSNRINSLSNATASANGEKLNIADTSYLLQKRDTITLSNRINLKLNIRDTVGLFDSRFAKLLNITDTVSLLQKSDTSFLLQRSDTSTLSSRINLKLNIADTALMLTNRIKRDTSFLIQKADTAAMLSSRFARDTVKLSARLDDVNALAITKLAISDTLNMLTSRFARDTASLSSRINLKLNSADTAAMFSSRMGKDTLSLSSRIDMKLNISDTSSMLTNRIKRDTSYLSLRIDSKLNLRDTAILSNRIITSVNNGTTKLNTSDTANMLSSRFYRDTASLSNRINDLAATTSNNKLNIIDTVLLFKKSDTSFLFQKKDTSFLFQKKDTSTLSNRINYKLNITDTSFLFKKTDTSFLHQKKDTITLSNRINYKLNITDTSLLFKKTDTSFLHQKKDTITLSNRINYKLNITDTSLLFKKTDTSFLYQKKDTSTLSNRINLKFNIIDTSLLFKKTDTSFLHQKKDTVTLSNRINLKLNITDTSLLFKKTDTSFLYQKKDTSTLSNRIIFITVRDVSDEKTISTTPTATGYSIPASPATTATFTLSFTPHVNSKVKMYINGVRISNTAYTWSGVTLTYTYANNGSYIPITGDRIQFDYFY